MLRFQFDSAMVHGHNASVWRPEAPEFGRMQTFFHQAHMGNRASTFRRNRRIIMKKPTENETTHITIILDRTGSMESIREDTIGGFNTFLKEQKEIPGKVTLSLIQFDTVDPFEIIHDMKPIEHVQPLTRETYVPRAATPLLDAMGNGINHLKQTLKGIDKAIRPRRIVMVVITDGQENSSCEFRKDQIVRMISKQQEKAGWQFVFLSADLDAMNDAMAAGFRHHASLCFDKNREGVRDAWGSMSEKIRDYRNRCCSIIEFSDGDRQRQRLEGLRKKQVPVTVNTKPDSDEQ